MKYKLLKDYPFCNYSGNKSTLITIKPNAIFTRTINGCYLHKVNQNVENNVVLMHYVVEDNKEWFAKFLGISEDKVDIYEGDSLYVYNYQDRKVIACEQITEVLFEIYKDKNVKMFVSKEQAERYYSKQYPKTIDDLDVNLGYYGVYSTYATLIQRQSAIAFAKLTKLHKAMIDIYNKETNCNWQPNWLDNTSKYTVTRNFNKLEIYGYTSVYKPLIFPTQEMATFSLEHHKDLWKQYYEL